MKSMKSNGTARCYRVILKWLYAELKHLYRMPQQMNDYMFNNTPVAMVGPVNVFLLP